MPNNILSIEGNIVNNDKQLRRRIEIDQINGLITKVSEPTGSANFVFKNELVFPGFVDIHVHAREDTSHTQDYKEDFKTAGFAAINGGVVAIAEMPNNPIPPVDDTSYSDKEKLTKKSPIEVLLYAGIGPHTKPLSKNVPYKVFMGPSVGELFFSSKKELEKTIKFYKGQNVSFHCEDPKILEKCASSSTHENKRPKEAEILAIDFALYLIEKYKIIGKICHCSTMEGIQKIINAKKRGVNVTVEITPHHLFFDETLFDEKSHTLLQVNPPIRQTVENRLCLITALKNGDIDYIATDHAPHTIEEKKKGISGISHLDTFGFFVTWLIKEHKFIPEEITKVCSYNPGKFISQFIENKYGKIRKGYEGSLTIIDMGKPVTITKKILKTKCGWSPFEGVTFPGSVIMTIIKGKIYEK